MGAMAICSIAYPEFSFLRFLQSGATCFFQSFIPLNGTSKKSGARTSKATIGRRATPTVYSGCSGLLLALSSTTTEYLGHASVKLRGPAQPRAQDYLNPRGCPVQASLGRGF